jgi:radical SAM superfamily enzyme YgiQ (UPF0313 family)
MSIDSRTVCAIFGCSVARGGAKPMDLNCHLIDFVSVPSIGMSLPLAYLQAAAESDKRLAAACRFSQQCHFLGGKNDQIWQTLVRSRDNHLGEKQVVAFTNFCWNTQLSLRLAQRIRATFPETLIVFGGNDVAHQSDWVLDDGTSVDVLVNGEGETVFADVLAAYLESGSRRDFHHVRGVSFRAADGRAVTTAPRPVSAPLDDLHSPFSGGDVAAALARSTAAICEFSRGCPFECSFYNWGGAIGTQVRRFSLDRITHDIEFLVSNLPNNALVYIADANFGMTDADLEAAHVFVDTVKRHNKRIYVFTNFPKNTNERVVETRRCHIATALISMVTLSAQSLSPAALAIAKRKNMPFENYVRLQERFRTLGVPTYTELLIGMPGETYESFLLGIERVLESGGRPVIYTLLLLNNTHYANPEVRQEHGLKSKLMPFHSLDLSIRAETSIGHDRLSYQEWLVCVVLMIVVPIFYFGCLRFVIERLRAECGVPYGRMLDRLAREFMAGTVRSHPLVQRLFLNYVETWNDPAACENELLASITGPISGQLGSPHYQAIMKVLTTGLPATEALVEELTQGLATLSDRPVAPATLSAWIQYQQAIVHGLALASKGAPGDVFTPCNVEDLQEFAGSPVVVDDGSRRTLRVQSKFKRYSFDDCLFQLLYGTCNTLSLFEAVDGNAALPARAPASAPPTAPSVS